MAEAFLEPPWPPQTTCHIAPAHAIFCRRRHQAGKSREWLSIRCRDFEPRYQKIQQIKLCAAWVVCQNFLRRKLAGELTLVRTFDDRRLKGIENQPNRANNREQIETMVRGRYYRDD
jgi:hypothetical protein